MFTFRNNARIPAHLSDWLDIARGLAAIEVLAFHSYQLMFLERLPPPEDGTLISWCYRVLWAFSAHGVSAVMVFFVLSGYLVGGPALVRARASGLKAVDYFAARWARLYVVLVPALLLTLGAFALSRHLATWPTYVAAHQGLFDAAILFSADASPATAACNLLFLQTIGCSEFGGNIAWWSLSNEFWYYILIFALVSLPRTPLFAVLVVAIFALFGIAEHADSTGTHVGLKFAFYFLIWGLGALAYAIVAPLQIWLATFAASLGVTYLAASHGLMPHWAAHLLTVGLVTAAAIVCLERTSIALPSFLRATRHTAKFSFSLYATHYPILVLLNVALSSTLAPFSFASLGLAATFMACCLLISILFYIGFERHTPAVRAWLQGLMERGVRAFQSDLRPAIEAAQPLANKTVLDVVWPAPPPAQIAAMETTEPARSGEGTLPSAPALPVFANIPRLALRDGHSIPQLGLGVWQINGPDAAQLIGTAIKAGYRLIDTAANYGNEAAVGLAMAHSAVPREQFFITTKLWSMDHGYDQALRGFDSSLAKLGLDHVDLYLIHWPCPQRRQLVDSWRALIELRRQGRARSIGVSNFTAEHLDIIINETGEVPVLNQIELHPHFQQHAMRAVHQRYGIATQSWSPLGRGTILADPAISAIAARLGRSPAQVVQRWHIGNGLIAIPKSAAPQRMIENLDVFGFALAPEDLETIAGLDRPDGRIGPDPDVFRQQVSAARSLELRLRRQWRRGHRR
jgi:diketogulonate reductase-like aldo/keto reductase/peptidoglycan/LPS O-acetylase OafA/YrhL